MNPKTSFAPVILYSEDAQAVHDALLASVLFAHAVKPADRYHRFVRWSAEDQCYMGYCPDLYYGGAWQGDHPCGSRMNFRHGQRLAIVAGME